MKKLRVTVEGETFEVEVEEVAETPPRASPREARPANTRGWPRKESRGWLPPVIEGAVVAPMPGNIMLLNVQPGDEVKAGDILLVMESMKIETPIPSPKAGVVKAVLVSVGQFVKTRQPMVALE